MIKAMGKSILPDSQFEYQRHCSLSGCEGHPQTSVVVSSYGVGRTYEVPMCASCYEDYGVMYGASELEKNYCL